MQPFLIIGFTTPDAWESPEIEALEISKLLLSGAIDIFHIRKKEAVLSYTRELIKTIPVSLHKRLVNHSNYELTDDFNLGGIHNQSSRSCHSLEEFDNFDASSFRYSFLSPIFDSISKDGYCSKFNLESRELAECTSKYPIIALGGVKPSNFKQLYTLKFAGAALLGYLWAPKLKTEEKIKEILEYRTMLTSGL